MEEFAITTTGQRHGVEDQVKRLHLVIFFMTATTGRMRCWRAIRL
ncbi:hypothetical protein PVAP13_4NG174333 [Panicum virgatum]|uniref:Uncharacterized protein n=1 Tax=Panicum virgatum TaxID=38727 RepID=A0A8T0T3W6_PANVG|nr:hypothetical protein PVAP13_4NG174333 [Panicum virgatum]